MFHTNEPSPTIVFEDCSPNGWVMADDFMGFDLPTTKLIIQRLAQFHASSIYMDRGVSNRYFHSISFANRSLLTESKRRSIQRRNL